MSLWMLVCTREVIKHKHRKQSRVEAAKHHVCAVRVVLFIPHRIKHITNEAWFLPSSPEQAIYKHKYELALLQCPQVNCAHKREKAILWHLKWWLKFQKQSSYLQHSCFTDTKESCRGTLCLGGSFSKMIQLTTLIQKSYIKRSKTFHHSIVHPVWSLILCWLIQTSVPERKPLGKALGMACFHIGKSSCCPGAH